MVFGSRKVIWSSRAKKEKRNIFKYWNNRNKSQIYSKKLNGLFNEKISLITEKPFVGRKTNIKNVRIVLVKNNLLIYKIFKSHIIIVSVWEGRQNPENLEIDI